MCLLSPMKIILIRNDESGNGKNISGNNCNYDCGADEKDDECDPMIMIVSETWWYDDSFRFKCNGCLNLDIIIIAATMMTVTIMVTHYYILDELWHGLCLLHITNLYVYACKFTDLLVLQWPLCTYISAHSQDIW